MANISDFDARWEIGREGDVRSRVGLLWRILSVRIGTGLNRRWSSVLFRGMTRSVSIAWGAVILALVAGLTMALPIANAQSTVAVKILSGAGVGPSSAPGYSPDSITLVIGLNSTVTWTNDDSSVHTVTSSTVPAGAASFDSGYVSPGDTFTQTFTVAGTYQYYCSVHSWMTGTIIVKAATVPEFPSAYVASTLFAVMASVVVAVARLGPRSFRLP